MYTHVLAPTDLTDDGKETVHKAWELANQYDAKLSLVHVIEPIPAYGYPGMTDILSPHIEQAKVDLAQLGEELNIPVEDQHVELGPTKVSILHLAEKLKADLIIVGSHGRHGISRLLGSTANAVLHGAQCDVLTVRHD